jgi:DNA (cytosine-5)-methyltransferase 1
LRDIVAVDLFCGAGGTSTGLLQAAESLGLNIQLTAINHWKVAIASHMANHPNVRHINSTIEKLDPFEVVPGKRVDLLVASPECRHHSTARGGRPINDQKRASAWYILRWAELLYIKNILIENVPEFKKWGPVNAKGKRIKALEGTTYKAFIGALESLGYKVEERVLNAADFGDATTRRRLFIIARRHRSFIPWPKATRTQAHWTPAKKVIDWSLPGISIFNRKAVGLPPLAPKTIERIAEGIKKFAGPWAEPFLVLLRGTGKTRSIKLPLPALTAGGQHVALCDPFILAHRVFDQSNVDSIHKPLRTLTGSGRDWSMAQPFLVNTEHHGGNGKNVRSPEDPLYTISTKTGMSVVVPFIVPNFGERKGQKPRTHGVDKPLPAPTGHGAGALVEPFIVTPGGADLHGGRSVKKPLPTVTCTDRFAVATPYIVNMKGKSKTRSVERPLPTQTTRKHVYLAQPFVLPRKGFYNSTGNVPRSVDKPLPTATSRGAGYIVEPYMVKVNNGKKRRAAASVDKPMPTLTTKNGVALVAPMLVKYFGTGQAKNVNEPVPTLTTKPRAGLCVPVANGEYAIDILFRMLTPGELAAAMSFPKGYKFTGRKEDVVKQIGNAVAVKKARALCRAILKAEFGKAGA